MMGGSGFTEREDELHVGDRKDTSHDDSVEGQRTSTTTKDTIDTRKGLAISSEETVTTGAFVAPRTAEQAAAERERVQTRIDEAKLDLTIEVMVGTGKAMALVARATQMDNEAAQLETFEPALVEGKREQLKRDAAAARATAKAIVKETEGRQKLIEDLEAERAGLEDRDAWRVASDLAKAELAFRQTTKVTKKHSLGFNALKGELSAERGIAETRTDEGGSTTNSRGSKSTGKIGKGAHLSHTETAGTKIEDADGNLVRDEQTSATAKAGLALGKDGSVGVDGGAKLTKAIETSHGKATTSVAFDGSVTVNIVALPRATPDAEQKYSVVVTMNLAAALAFGLSKTGKHKHGKGTAGIDL
jgi:hypothetical protein